MLTGSEVRQNLDQMSVSQHQEFQCEETSLISSYHCKIWWEFVLGPPVFIRNVCVHLNWEIPTFNLELNVALRT